ncbi:MAG: hypothetical protein HPY69_08315 [Armatimonadetes bacterium]|nr:hypothetical protein [Armatimonadota bacterium]
MRTIWRKIVTPLALLATSLGWAQEPSPEELAARQRAATGLLFTMFGGLVLVFLLMRLLSRRERLRAQQHEQQDGRDET